MAVVLGVIGIIIPGLPTTPFLLVAAVCFSKSSQKYYIWLTSNKYFGKYIDNYRTGKGVPLKIKIVSVLILWATILSTVTFSIKNIYLKALLLLIASAVTFHLYKIKTFR